jgi:hypothetical protein
VQRDGGLVGKNMARFFELRFGHALYEAGIGVEYEVPGEDESTLDFGFTSKGQAWKVVASSYGRVTSWSLISFTSDPQTSLAKTAMHPRSRTWRTTRTASGSARRIWCARLCDQAATDPTRYSNARAST